MNSNELQVSLMVFFKALMENRSMMQSAEELGISPAKASRSLTKLRLIFKDPLFIRTRREMAPTAKAKKIFPLLVDLIYQLENSPIDLDVDQFRGTIRISAVDNGVMMFISPTIGKILEHAPQLKVEVSPLNTNVYERIESGSLDMAIYPDTILPSDFHEAILYEDYYVTVVHRDHPLANYAKSNKIPSVEEVNRYQKVEVVVRGSENQSLEEQIYANQLQKTCVSTPYFFSVPFLLSNCALTATLTYSTARALCQCAPIVILPAPKPYKTYKARLIWHHRTHHDPILKWVRQLIIDGAKKAPFLNLR